MPTTLHAANSSYIALSILLFQVVARPFCWSTIASNHGVYSRQCFNDAMLWASQAARKISSWRLFVSASSSNQSPPLETVSRKYSINDATNAAHHSNHRASQEHSQQYLTSAAAGLVDTLSAENRELSFWASDTANSGIVRHKPGSSDAAPACHFVAPRRVAQALSRWPCSASRNLASNTVSNCSSHCSTSSSHDNHGTV